MKLEPCVSNEDQTTFAITNPRKRKYEENQGDEVGNELSSYFPEGSVYEDFSFEECLGK